MPLIWVDGSNWDFNAPDLESNQTEEDQLDSETLRRKRLAEQWKAWGKSYSFESINLMSPDHSSHFVPSPSWYGGNNSSSASRKRARNIEDEECDDANNDSAAIPVAKRLEITPIDDGGTDGENDNDGIESSAPSAEESNDHKNSPTAEAEHQTKKGE